jgi:hypothetical protein
LPSKILLSVDEALLKLNDFCLNAFQLLLKIGMSAKDFRIIYDEVDLVRQYFYVRPKLVDCTVRTILDNLC